MAYKNRQDNQQSVIKSGTHGSLTLEHDDPPISTPLLIIGWHKESGAQ